jgi:hypothetical protein
MTADEANAFRESSCPEHVDEGPDSPGDQFGDHTTDQEGELAPIPATAP